MNKLLGLFLLALAFFAPDLAHAANRFAVCTTTCTWDNTDTSMWSTTSGGATGASAPVAGDAVILDAATCVGGTTCTITTFAGTITVDSITMSACTASTSGCILDASANDTNFVLQFSGNAYVNTGSGTRTLNMGDGTWTLSGNGAVWNIVASATLNANASTIAFTGTGSARRVFTSGNKTYNTLSVAGASSGVFVSNGSPTIGTLTVGAPNWFLVGSGSTLTVTTITDVTGSSSNQVLFSSTEPGSGVVTFSSANNWTCSWCGFAYTTFTGGGTFSATNSFSFTNNTGITITPPSVGGGGGGRIIGG